MGDIPLIGENPLGEGLRLKVTFQIILDFLERLFLRIGHRFLHLQIFHKVIDGGGEGDCFNIKGEEALLGVVKDNG